MKKKEGKMKKTILSISAILLGIGLVGCGGSSSSSSSTTSVTKVGYYVDAPVEGVSYQCGEKTGVTDKDGKFEFEEGKNCVFSVGNITLRTVLADVLEDNGYVFEDNILNAQLLQSLDIDANVSNGITISKDEVEVLKNVSQPSAKQTFKTL
jgi:hypothetical protein